MFIDHFQEMARGHFIVRGLERSHGLETVRRIYAELEGVESEQQGWF